MPIYNNKKKILKDRVPQAPSSESDTSKKLTSTVESSSSDILEGAVDQFKSEQPHWDFSKVVLSEAVQIQLDAALDRVRYQNILFEDWGLKEVDPKGSRSVINFYGLPGTGKSMSAEAIANELGRSIIKVSYAELESKYVGDTPKNIKRAFAAAKIQNAVIFFDEADSILGKRLSSVTQGADHSVNVSRSVMLQEMDEFAGVVIFATNLARNYDSAFVRRIHSHIKFELPNQQARESIFKQMLVANLPLGPTVTPQYLAQITEGLSGGDLRTVVINAAAKAVSRTGVDQVVKQVDFSTVIDEIFKAKQEIIGTTHEKKVSEETVSVSQLPSDVKNCYDHVINEPNHLV